MKFNDNTDGKVVDKVTFLQWDKHGVPCIIVKVLPLASETVNYILSQMKLILEGKGAEGITFMSISRQHSGIIISSGPGCVDFRL